MKNQTLTVAAIQMTCGADIAENIENASMRIREAAALGAIYVQTPENTSFMAGSPDKIRALARMEEEDEALKAFCTLAKALSITLHIGSLPVRLSQEAQSKIANRSFIISPDGDILARYDKIHMFDVNLGNGESYHESETYEAGKTATIVSLPLANQTVKLGMGICYDIRFPHLYRTLAQNGAQIITAPAAFTAKTGEAHWHVLLRARAIETGSFMIAAAQGGTHPHGRQTYGHALIISPWGDILAEGGIDPCVICAEIDLAEVEKWRQNIPAINLNQHFEMTRYN